MIDKYPKISFMLCYKLYWLVSFIFTIYVINDHIPTLRQFLLASIYTIITLPCNYWLTYRFGDKKEK